MCDCPPERCNEKYGCLQESAVEDKKNTSVWVNVTYALIGSVTTMSLIGVMVYLKSWFSKTNTSFTVTNQLYSDQTENQEENRYESRRNSSSNETENVLQNHPDLNDYTDLRLSRMQPQYDDSKDSEGASEPATPSVHSLLSSRTKNDHNKEVIDKSNGGDLDEAYERYFEHEGYNVLSLRKPSIQKSMTLRSFDSAFKLGDNAEGMHDEYDSIEMKDKQKVECASELGIKKIKFPEKVLCQKSSIDETIKHYIESAQLNRKLGLKEGNETSALNSISKSKSFTVRESDRPKRFSSRPYSSANSSWRKRHAAGLSKLSRISDYEEVFSLEEDEECDGDKCSDSNIQSNNESFDDQSIATVSIVNENKKPPISSEGKENEFAKPYEEIDLLENESHTNTNILNQIHQMNTVRFRNDHSFNLMTLARCL
ncbi:uncharacterized protein LOC134240386 [Saccostrea cucullata]|uniref:uncharacterized protein LOC134240386 n=1 Tax=Saccostrea cuccullata TaxID=36930 RepID=UPI002ED6B5E7